MDLGPGEVEPEFPPSWDPNPLDLGPGVKEIQVWVREDLVWVQEDVVWVREQRKIPLRPPPTHSLARLNDKASLRDAKRKRKVNVTQTYRHSTHITSTFGCSHAARAADLSILYL